MSRMNLNTSQCLKVVQDCHVLGFYNRVAMGVDTFGYILILYGYDVWPFQDVPPLDVNGHPVLCSKQS